MSAVVFSLLLIFSVYEQSKVLTNEVINTTQHTWIVQGTVGSGIAICVVMVKACFHARALFRN